MAENKVEQVIRMNRQSLVEDGGGASTGYPPPRTMRIPNGWLQNSGADR